MSLHHLDACLESLKQQGISVSRGVVGENGFVFHVMGFMLTVEQIVKLGEYGRLNSDGIKAFAKSVEGKKDAHKILPDPTKQ